MLFCLANGDHRRLQRADHCMSTASTDCARLRNASSMYALSHAVSAGWWRSHLGSVGVGRCVIGRRARGLQSGERIGVARRRRVGRMRREGRHLDHKRLALRLLDELHRQFREHVGQVVGRFIAVGHDLAILVEG